MTKITLLRAARLQASIHETLKTIPVTPKAELSIYANLADGIAAEQAKLKDSRARRERLITALFDIRRKTAVANAEAGLSDVLADQAENDMRIELLTNLATAKPFEGMDVTARRADRMTTREEPASPYRIGSGTKETMEVGLLTAEEIEEHRVALLALKKKRADLKDRLAELNAGNSIKLSDETAETLKAEHLL